jgi:hypothetical protein
MLKIKKNNKGFVHHIAMPLVVVAVIAAVGVKIALSASHADSVAKILYCGYVTSGGATSSVFAINADGTSKLQLSVTSDCYGNQTTNDNTAGGNALSWANNGTVAIYVEANTINTVSSTGQNARVIYTAPNDYSIKEFSYSEKAQKIAFAEWNNGAGNNDYKIKLMNLDGSHVVTLDEYKPITGYTNVQEEWLSWSPNGQNLLYSAEQATTASPQYGQPYDQKLIAQNVTTGKRTFVFHESAPSGAAYVPGVTVGYNSAWSNDSGNIALTILATEAEHNPSVALERWSTTTNKFTNLLSADVGTNAAWSPDGSKIAFSMQTWKGTEVFNYLRVMNANGTNPKTIYTTTGNPSNVANPYIDWSPDSSKIAFLQYGVLRTINPDGTDPVVVAGSGGNVVYNFEWSVQ